MDFSLLYQYPDQYLEGFIHTIQSSLTGFLCSYLIGMILALFRMLPISFFNKLARVFIELVQYIPLLLFVFFFYIGLPALGFPLNGFIAGTIGLCIYTGTFIGEAIHNGVQSIPKGQMDAAKALGLSYVQAMRYVILPQATKNIFPALGNQLINLIKNSSILGIVAGVDLMYQTNLINENSFHVSSIYLLVAIFYLILIVPLSFFVAYLERHWMKNV